VEKKRIMLVDDEEDVLKTTKLILEQAGNFEVLALSNAKDIITQLHNFKPDVILLDLLMPFIGGIEVCEMLNKDSMGKQVPIIILSALSKDSDKLISYKSGAVDYIVKPIDSEALIKKIEKVLRFKCQS